LTDIPGVGEKRARILLNKLGSLAKIRQCSVEEIAAASGFSQKLAATILEHLTR
jgi:excinuclease ABC subunit C